MENHQTPVMDRPQLVQNELANFDIVGSAEHILATHQQVADLGATALDGVDPGFMDAMHQMNTAFTTLSADDLEDGTYNAQQQAALASYTSANPMQAITDREDSAIAAAYAQTTDRIHRDLIEQDEIKSKAAKLKKSDLGLAA